jgi:ECF sigma factor
MARVDHSTAVDFDQLPAVGSGRATELRALDDALNSPSQMDARRAQVIELRFFGGLAIDETAEVLKISSQRGRITGSPLSGVKNTTVPMPSQFTLPPLSIQRFPAFAPRPFRCRCPRC